MRRRLVASLNTQCLKNSVVSKEQCVLTLGSLYLPCYTEYSVKLLFYLTGSQGAVISDYKYDGCGFESHSGKLIIPFSRSSKKAKRSVDFLHATHNVSRIRPKMRNRVS